MKKILFILGLGAFFALSSCSKGCVTCVGGEWDDYEVCSDDGFGRLSTKAFKQDCKAGGGNPQ